MLLTPDSYFSLMKRMNIWLLFRSLSCDEECAIIERNKRFAEALSIETDEYGSSARYRYSEFLMNAAK